MSENPLLTNYIFLVSVFDNILQIQQNSDNENLQYDDVTTINFIKNVIQNLYMVFYYSDKSNFTLGEGCTPLINNTDIETNQKMMNYIFTDNNNKLYLLSSKGFTKNTFGKLKEFLTLLKTSQNINEFLNEECKLCSDDNFQEYNIVAKKGGNNKKSNKRQNKQPRKNKSLKRKN